MASTLYGFAEEAERCGNIHSRDAALNLAKDILNEDEYREVISRRVGPNGEFKITKEDL